MSDNSVDPDAGPDIELGPYDSSIFAFADFMRYKLEKNSHKGRWEDLDLPNCFRMLDDEMTELEREVRDLIHGGTPTENAVMKLVLEAADVANFALIIASIAMKLVGRDLENMTPPDVVQLDVEP